jgi:hypothetical protein
VNAACGRAIDEIFLYDLGQGDCESYTLLNGASDYTFGNCTELVYGRNCKTFNGRLYIHMYNLYGLNPSTYVNPDINKGLTGLGLANLEWATNLVSVFTDHSYFPLPRPIAPVFLTSLKSAGDLQVVECSPCSFPYPFSASSVLTGLPGFTNLYQISRPAGTFSQLRVHNTLFTDLTSFSGLTCSPRLMFIDDNSLMTSFRGLGLVSSPPSPGVQVTAGLSGPFTTAESLNPIKVLGGCYDNVATNTAVVRIPVGCGRLLTAWQDVCTFQGSPSPCPPG